MSTNTYSVYILTYQINTLRTPLLTDEESKAQGVTCSRSQSQVQRSRDLTPALWLQNLLCITTLDTVINSRGDRRRGSPGRWRRKIRNSLPPTDTLNVHIMYGYIGSNSL